MAFPSGLAEVDKEVFARVWAVATGLEERERHFNQLQSRYRTLASTWLLATFAAIGFLLSTPITPPQDIEQLVIGVALAGATGMVLLWILDVLVYHELLVAGYVAGTDLEASFTWLPPVRSTFAKLTADPVRVYIAANLKSYELIIWWRQARNQCALCRAGAAPSSISVATLLSTSPPACWSRSSTGLALARLVHQSLDLLFYRL